MATDRRLPWRVPWYIWLAVGLAIVAAIHVRDPHLLQGKDLALAVPGVAVLLLIAAILWELPPAVMACGAIALTVFSGNWSTMGLPGFPLVPDRLLIAGVVIALLLKSPGAVGTPRLHVRGIHVLMLTMVLYVFASGIATGHIGNKTGQFRLFDQVGAIPFLMFLIGPVVFSGERERGWLLATLVGLGAYLGLTAIFETVGPHALVFPSYIRSIDVSRDIAQATGPFSAVVTEGFACYACAIASIIAVFRWARPWRYVALTVAFVSLLGTYMSLERGVWIGAVAGAVAVAAFAREVRRFVIPGAAVCAVIIGGALALFPSSLGAATTTRLNNHISVWDRQNQTTAALNMIQARPLLGFGWNNYVNTALPYFRQSPRYPLVGYPSSLNPAALGSTAVHDPSTGRTLQVGLSSLSLGLHNTYLAYAVELGLVGACLWLMTVVWGLGDAVFRSGPPELRPWKLGLLALTVCYLVIAAVDPLSQNFTQLLLWSWAGVAVGMPHARRTGRRSAAHDAEGGDEPSRRALSALRS
jgi:putative inorganic carbon (hco3(-)) transporter